MTAYRRRPRPCQRRASSIDSAAARSGVVSSACGSSRSLTTRPEAIRRPDASASAKNASIATAKWAPNTRADVVPARASEPRNSRATSVA